MKKLVVMAGLMLVMSIQTYAVNITINDGRGTGSSWYSADRENNEVEPGCTPNQFWDLESFDLTDSVLTLTGGYNFRNGYQGMAPGDVFVDLNNGAGWDYVFDISGLNVSVVDLNQGLLPPRFHDVLYSQNAQSNPWTYVSGGAEIATGGVRYQTPWLDDEGYHYTMELDIRDILGDVYGSGATFHYTMQCGNDNLVGQVQSVPEGGTTLASLLVGLFGIGFLKKRM